MRVRSSLAVLTCSAVLVACSSGKDTTQRADKATGETTVTTTIGQGDAANGTGAPGATTGPGGTGVKGDVAGATAALNTYLDAVAANDYPKALVVSRDALQSLTVVRSIVHAGNAERGGKTTSTYGQRSFDVSGATADEVRFGGRASLTSLVSGPAGPPLSTTDTFKDLVVRRGSDGWRVAAATYNNAPLISFPADTSTTIGPVQITLKGALAFGSSLGVVVQLVADGDHTIAVSGDALRINDEEAPSKSTLIVSGQPGFIYLTYPRRDQQPTRWRATVTIDGTPHPVSLAF